MRPAVIPQIRTPSLVYGIGVRSPFFALEERLSLPALERLPPRVARLLDRHNLLSGIKLEASVLTAQPYEEKSVEADAAFMLDASLCLTIAKDATVTVTVPRAGKEWDAHSLLLEILPGVKADLVLRDENPGGGTAGLVVKAVVGKGASLTMNDLLITDADTFRRTTIVLAGEDSGVLPNHAFFAYGKAKVDVRSQVVHAGAASASDIRIRGIAAQEAEVITQGDIRIEPAAAGANGYQHEDLIMLGKKSVARPIPNLEIGNHEVRCTHGATVANIDEDTLFFLTSRGIPREKALSVVLASFLSPLLTLFPAAEGEHIRDSIAALIAERGMIGG